jgi:anti-sigma B factor antagonist
VGWPMSVRRFREKRGSSAMKTDAEFEVTGSEQPGVPVLRVRGEIDVASAPEFQTSLSDLVGQGSEIVIVDLSEVSFIDSTGLGVLVGAEKEMRDMSHSLRLVVPQPQIMRLLELTGLDEVFTILSSTSDSART